MSVKECSVITDISGKELVNHGSQQFPVACYNDRLPENSFYWHWHDEFEVIVVKSGVLYLKSDGYTGEIHEGCGCFINSGILHEGYCKDNESCNIHSIVFNSKLIAESKGSIYYKKYVKPVKLDSACRVILFDNNMNDYKNAVNLIETAWNLCEKEIPGYEITVRESLTKLLFMLSSGSQPSYENVSVKMLRTSERVKLMLSYITANLDKEITVKEIAASANISESECLRCFRNFIGESPIKYVIRLRIEKAAGLLKTGSQQIDEIGTLCGFQDMSYFAKTFKKYKNCTPSEFRQIMF